MSCSNCDNSSTTYSRCNPLVSSNCVEYRGVNKECADDVTFTICKGQNMSIVQSNIFDRICQLIGDTSVTEVVIPGCLSTAWGTNDLTVLNLFQLALDNACDLQTQITNLSTAQVYLNPTVSVRPIGNCACDACRVELLLSDALNQIITEICNLKTTVLALQTQVNNVESSYTGLQTQLTALQVFNASQTALNVQYQIDIACLKAAVGSC